MPGPEPWEGALACPADPFLNRRTGSWGLDLDGLAIVIDPRGQAEGGGVRRMRHNGR
jgi:hypothetical protein